MDMATCFGFKLPRGLFISKEKKRGFWRGKCIDGYLHLVTYKGGSKLWRLFPAHAPNMFIERFLNLLYAVFSAAPLSKIF